LFLCSVIIIESQINTDGGTGCFVDVVYVTDLRRICVYYHYESFRKEYELFLESKLLLQF
jgi:hypothetical protein